MRRALWIVGEPAAGKSTAARTLLGELRNGNIGRQKWALGNGWISPGRYEGGHFDGADRVGMSQARAYLTQYLETPEHLKPRVGILLDGARFSTRPCFDMLVGTHRTQVLYLPTPSSLCAERRAARGWAPDASWLAGAITRAQRFRDYAIERGAELLHEVPVPKCEHPATYRMSDLECEVCATRRRKQRWICPYCDGDHEDCSSS